MAGASHFALCVCRVRWLCLGWPGGGGVSGAGGYGVCSRGIRSCFFLGGCRGCLYRGHCHRWACLGGVGGSGGRMAWGGGNLWFLLIFPQYL